MQGADMITSSTGQAPISTPFTSSLNASSLIALDAGQAVQVEFLSSPAANPVVVDGDASQFTLNWVGPQ